MKKRGQMDGLERLEGFGKALEEASLETLSAGTVTGDLVPLAEGGFPVKAVDSETFLDAVAERLKDKVQSL